jgi:hypothetical protein
MRLLIERIWSWLRGGRTTRGSARSAELAREAEWRALKAQFEDWRPQIKYCKRAKDKMRPQFNRLAPDDSADISKRREPFEKLHAYEQHCLEKCKDLKQRADAIDGRMSKRDRKFRNQHKGSFDVVSRLSSQEILTRKSPKAVEECLSALSHHVAVLERTERLPDEAEAEWKQCSELLEEIESRGAGRGAAQRELYQSVHAALNIGNARLQRGEYLSALSALRKTLVDAKLLLHQLDEALRRTRESIDWWKASPSYVDAFPELARFPKELNADHVTQWELLSERIHERAQKQAEFTRAAASEHGPARLKLTLQEAASRDGRKLERFAKAIADYSEKPVIL